MEELFKRHVLTNIGKYTRKIFLTKWQALVKNPFLLAFHIFSEELVCSEAVNGCFYV